MSPRSSEFMAKAVEKLRAARLLLDGGFPSPAVSAAYYAMLYAARAALSERDLNARTHGGIWGLFSATFVRSGEVDAALGGAGSRIQRDRERADYEAEDFEDADAEAILAEAERFVDAIGELFS